MIAGIQGIVWLQQIQPEEQQYFTQQVTDFAQFMN